MPLMVLMLDVSKLSGWLKTFACWRVTRRANDVRGEVRPERWEGGGAVQTQVVCTGRGPNDSRAERTWNILLMSVTLDVSKLSGWLNADAPLNLLAMVVTPEVFQLEMSALKFVNP